MKNYKSFKIIVVRHAQSVANVDGVYQGQTFDTDLSDHGKLQAKVLAKKLQEFNIDKIVASPLKRAQQTALEISNLIGCEIEFDRRLIEINHGIWEGKDKEWIMGNDLELYETWFKTPHLVKFNHGGESLNDVITRTKSFLDEYPFSNNTLIVTHDCIIRTILSIIAGNKLENFWDYSLDNASINVFEINNIKRSTEIKPILINELSHLKSLII